jgi:hypothetical protein
MAWALAVGLLPTLAADRFPTGRPRSTTSWLILEHRSSCGGELKIIAAITELPVMQRA